MAFRRHWLVILFALVLSAGQLPAATTKEDRTYAAAISAFQDGMWNRAETEFARFIQKYPASGRVPEAVLLQAEAEYRQGKLPEAIALLTVHQAGAGTWPTSTSIGLAKPNFKRATCRRGGNLCFADPQFPSHRCDCGPWWRRRRRMPGRMNGRRWTACWSRHGVFQRAVQMDPANELVARGSLLLAQAKFEQG